MTIPDYLTSDYPESHPIEYHEAVLQLVKMFADMKEELAFIDKLAALDEIATPKKAQLSEKQLKKLIKYAKTPMERKQYERQLNKLYKERKKHKSND